MTANRRSVRKRRSKHKGSMKIITLIVLVLCGVFGVFTWQNTQKSEQYALVQENLQQQIDDEEENQKAIEEQKNTLKEKKIALKKVEKEVATLEAKKAKADQKAAEEAKSPEPPSLQKIQPPVPSVPSLFGQVKPPSKDTL